MSVGAVTSRRRHTRWPRDWSSDVCSSDLGTQSAMDWQGILAHELLPHVINPARGWIASANHRSIGTFYPVALGLSTGSNGHTTRSRRLYERSEERRVGKGCRCRWELSQAEDGIRDGHVTGVQTCALPILAPNPRWTGRESSPTNSCRM